MWMLGIYMFIQPAELPNRNISRTDIQTGYKPDPVQSPCDMSLTYLSDSHLNTPSSSIVETTPVQETSRLGLYN